MFDFRYHALSLAAVLVALVIGLLLGVAIGDEQLVSSARQDLRGDLERRVSEARAESRDLREQLAARDDYEQQTYETLVGGRLDGRRVVLLFIGERSDEVFRGVREAVEPSGGEVSLVSTLRTPLDREAIGRVSEGTRYEQLPNEPDLLEELGRRVGVQLVEGGRLLRELRAELLQSSSGAIGPAEGLVIARSDGDDDEAEQADDPFVRGLIEGARSVRVPVVGVETAALEPSQVAWYVDRGLASVDNVDQIPGRASLVFVLSGAADGHYGVKSTADALLPEALVGNQ